MPIIACPSLTVELRGVLTMSYALLLNDQRAALGD
jgi:hypothetical protein